MEIRKSGFEDLDSMLEIYAYARDFMRKTGNPNQWITYPERDILENDIAKERSYVITENEKVIATFVFTTEEEESYSKLDGKWLREGLYGVIHRIAGDGNHSGILKTAVDFCFASVDDIRLDTHPDNKVMQHAAEKLGFAKCGTVYIVDDISDRSPRLAYEKIKE